MKQPGIDVVAVTVKVPHHRELVSAALAGGKAVYCEWPLGRDLDDARAMAALAAGHGARTAIGLQARQAPAIGFVQELLSDGYVGEVLSTTMVGLSVPGGVVVRPSAYMLDKTNGANVLTIATGHSLDTLNYILGEFVDLSAVSDLLMRDELNEAVAASVRSSGDADVISRWCASDMGSGDIAAASALARLTGPGDARFQLVRARMERIDRELRA